MMTNREIQKKMNSFSDEQDALLCSRYPLLYRNRNTPRHPLAYGFTCGQGWFDLIDRGSAKLEPLIQEQLNAGIPLEECLEAAQVKQKFTGLRFYTYGPTDERIDAIIKEMEEEAHETCELTGVRGDVLIYHSFKLMPPFAGWRYRVSRNIFKVLAEQNQDVVAMNLWLEKNQDKVTPEMEQIFKEHFWDLLA